MTVTVSPRSKDEQRVMRALNRLVRSGRPFTIDQIWDSLEDVRPAVHRSWLGRKVQEMQQVGTIRTTGWRETARSLPHSRPARVWQSTKEKL